MATPVALTSERASLLLLLRPKYVTMDITGAASAKTSKCFLIRFLSRPACIKKETSPKAAGAFTSMNMGAANLVHQQHENEAQYEGHTDVGVQLCVVVTVLMFMHS